MNIHIHENGILLVGKAWEIKARLKQQLKPD
ncbi:Z-ring formation inhibitor MciZ [Alkalihalobacillus sp. NPDC078783]